VILENELAKAKAKGKTVRNSKMDEIKLLKRDLDNKKIITKHLEEKNRQLEHHNQMIDTDNNQLNRSNILLSENISNMDEQIDRASVYTKRICLNTRQVERDLH
jgi:hypothetical protein